MATVPPIGAKLVDLSKCEKLIQRVEREHHQACRWNWAGRERLAIQAETRFRAQMAKLKKELGIADEEGAEDGR